MPLGGVSKGDRREPRAKSFVLLVETRCARHLEGGLGPSMIFAAASDNAEGIRLLCAHGGDCKARNFQGYGAAANAAAFGSRNALEELLTQGAHSATELSLALYTAMGLRGGSAQLVTRLLQLKADVNFQHHVRRDMSRVGRLFDAYKSWQHARGRCTVLSGVCYHNHLRTPLMAALQSAQHEAAAALIVAGASLEIQNCRGWRAEDFARGQSIPEWLQKGLSGDISDCEMVTTLALPTLNAVV